MTRAFSLLLLLLLAGLASAQNTANIDQSAHCRIRIPDGRGAISCGSGVLLGRNSQTGIVLTCNHIFADGAQGIVCEFPNGEQYGGRLLDADKAHDVAIVLIHRPSFEGVPLSPPDYQPQSLTVCGYGSGSFRSATGRLVSNERAGGAEFDHGVLSVAVRSGDSGGAVLDDQGRVYGVIWGCTGGQTRMFYGVPLWSLIAKVWPDHEGVELAQSCYRGVCRPPARAIYPSQQQPMPVTIRPVTPPPLVPVAPIPPAQPTVSCDCGEKWAALEKEKERLTAALSLEAAARLELIARIEDLENRPAPSLDMTEVDNRITQYFTDHPIDFPEQQHVPTAEEIAAKVDVPTMDEIEEAMQQRLEHSAQITLLDGTVQPQTRPLNEPLIFNQRSREPLNQ